MKASNSRECSLRPDALAWPDSHLFIDFDDARPLAQAIVDTIRDPLLVPRPAPACRYCKPRFLSDVHDEWAGRSGSSGLRAGRWPVGYPRASVVVEGRCATPLRDGGLRSRARFSRNRATHDAVECARGVQSKKYSQAHPHRRVMSVAAVQQQLPASSQGEPIEIGPYISRLCETLLASMTDDSRPVSLQFRANGGTASSAETVSIGLIVTELVINAFKHAFVGHRAQAGLSSLTRRSKRAGDLWFSTMELGHRRAIRIWIRPLPDWAGSSSRHSPNSLTLVWESRGPHRARRC